MGSHMSYFSTILIYAKNKVEIYIKKAKDRPGSLNEAEQ